MEAVLRTVINETDTTGLEGGCTGTVAVISPDNQMTVAYRGDSPLLVYRRNSVTGDVSLVGEYITAQSTVAPAHSAGVDTDLPPGFMLAGTDSPQFMAEFEEGGRLAHIGAMKTQQPMMYDLILKQYQGKMAYLPDGPIKDGEVPAIEVTRAFGDHTLPGLEREPGVFSINLNLLGETGDELIIVAGSDGLIKNMLPEHYASVIQKHCADGIPDDLAHRLTGHALGTKVYDNVTADVIICPLPQPGVTLPVTPEAEFLVTNIFDGHSTDSKGCTTVDAVKVSIKERLCHALGRMKEGAAHDPDARLDTGFQPPLPPHTGL